MIVLPDVNVLVYAFRRESSLHERYAAWLAELLGGAHEVAVTEATLTGFLRIVTNPRIYADPAPTSDALAFVDAVRLARRRRWVGATEAVWTTFSALVDADPHVRGNLVPDAWLSRARARARVPDRHGGPRLRSLRRTRLVRSGPATVEARHSRVAPHGVNEVPADAAAPTEPNMLVRFTPEPAFQHRRGECGRHTDLPR